MSIVVSRGAAAALLAVALLMAPSDERMERALHPELAKRLPLAGQVERPVGYRQRAVGDAPAPQAP